MIKEELHIVDALHNLEPWFLEHFCQLYLHKSSGKMEPEGSGFLLQVFGVNLLLTAGHVIMDGKINEIVIPRKNSKGSFSLSGTWYPSDMNHNIGTDSDDFAYLIMQDETYVNFINSGYKFINLKNINFNHTPKSNNIYTVVGCKWRKTKILGYDKFVQVEVISNFGADNFAYKNNDLIENRIIIKNQRKFVNFNKQRTPIGKLEGMSGGPIWSTSLDHDYNKESPTIELVGVLNSYSTQFIYGTNISRLMTKLVERNHGNFSN